MHELAKRSAHRNVQDFRGYRYVFRAAGAPGGSHLAFLPMPGHVQGAMSTPFVIVSSMPLRMVVSPEPRRLVATCLALSLPLIVVHDGPDGSQPSPGLRLWWEWL